MPDGRNGGSDDAEPEDDGTGTGTGKANPPALLPICCGDPIVSDARLDALEGRCSPSMLWRGDADGYESQPPNPDRDVAPGTLLAEADDDDAAAAAAAAAAATAAALTFDAVDNGEDGVIPDPPPGTVGPHTFAGAGLLAEPDGPVENAKPPPPDGANVACICCGDEGFPKNGGGPGGG